MLIFNVTIAIIMGIYQGNVEISGTTSLNATTVTYMGTLQEIASKGPTKYGEEKNMFKLLKKISLEKRKERRHVSKSWLRMMLRGKRKRPKS